MIDGEKKKKPIGTVSVLVIPRGKGTELLRVFHVKRNYNIRTKVAKPNNNNNNNNKK